MQAQFQELTKLGDDWKYVVPETEEIYKVYTLK